MPRKPILSRTDQVAELLRQGIIEGRWQGTLPGRDHLALELGCSDWTVEIAVRRLAKEGLLVSQGAGRRKRITLTPDLRRKRAMRVMILLYESSDRKTGYLVDLLHRLQESGHQAGFAVKTMKDLGMDTDRIRRYIRQTEADAWILLAGPLDILDWLALQTTPSFALFGRLTRIPMAGASPKKGGALAVLVRRLVELGHQRIVMLAREERRKPVPGFFENFFLRELQEHGIPTGSFNLPDWGDNPEELQRVLTSLFQHTPPTALIIDDTRLFFAAMQHLARLGFVAPEQVSLACTDYDPNFEWFLPPITHIAWDNAPLIQRAIKWADNISRGKEDRRWFTKNARLVIGGTIGPAPR